MVALTRIKNNQITDSTVNAAAKLQDYSITSGKLANNITYGSDLTVSGNLTVNGQTTTIDTNVTTIEDPVILLASTQSGAPAVDIGFIGERGSSDNIAFVWDESADEFVTAFTSTSETNTTISISSYASFKTLDAAVTGNLTVTGTTGLTGNLTLGNLSVGSSKTLIFGDNVLANVGTPSLDNDAATKAYVDTAVSSSGFTVTDGVSNATIEGGDTIEFTGTASEITVTQSGNASYATFTFGLPDNVIVAGSITGNSISSNTTISATGNVSGGNVTTGGVVSATGNVSGGNITTGGEVVATGNITGGNLATSGSGGSITLSGGNISGANDISSNTVTATGNVSGGNVTTGGVVEATGNVSGGNITTGGQVVATGNVTGGNLTTAGDVTTSTVTATGNVTGGNLTTAGDVTTSTVTATGNVTGGNITTGGEVVATANITTSGNLVTLGGNLHTNVVNCGSVSSFGNVTGGNITTAGNVVASGIVDAYAITATANITGGNLNTGGVVEATGNVSGGNITTGGNVVATGNVSGGNVTTGGIVDATGNITGGNLVTVGLTNTGTLQCSGNAIVDGNLVVNGNLTYINIDDLRVSDPIIVLGTGPNGAPLTTNDGLDRGIFMEYYTSGLGNAFMGWDNSTGNMVIADSAYFSANDVVGVNTYGTLQAGNLYVESVYSVGNVTGGNLITAGTFESASVSATGNITGGNLITGGNVDATGTVTGGNLSTAGTVTATGNVSGGNVTTGGVVEATGNVSGGNITTGGEVVATANITTSGNLVTLGGNLHTNVVNCGSVSSFGNVNGGNITTAGNVVASGIVDAYAITATANITGGNLNTGGVVEATGNVSGGNITTGGNVVATGNVSGGNITTGGIVDATGNITGGNLITGGLISVTGNINGTGAVFSGNVTADTFIGNISGNIDAGGANTNIQFNDGDLLAGSAAFTFNKTSNAVVATGNITGGNLITAGDVSTATVTATGNVTGGNITTGGEVVATGNITGGNLATSGSGGSITLTGGNISGADDISSNTVTATANVSGANVVGTTAVIGGNIVISGDNITDTNGRVNFNTAGADVDFAVNGDTVANVFYVDAGTGTVSFGSSTQTTGAIAAFNTSASVLMPVGNVGTRPATGVTGMLRFSTTENALEIYDNTQWSKVGVPSFTVITNDAFAGDGSTVAFTLSESASTDSCIVSINGVVQIPTTAYSVSGTTLTFTEAPQTGDAIDVRILTTTTSVTEISNGSGNALVQTLDTANTVQITGSLLPVANAAQSLGSATKQWSSLYVAGNTIYLGDLQLKASGTTFTVYQSDGVTQANIDAGSIDVSSIASGTSAIGISGTNGNAYITVGGTANVIVASTTGANVTGTLGVSGNITGGNLSTAGSAFVGGNLTVNGNVTITGNITQVSGNSGSFFGNTTTGYGALYAGIPSGYANLPSTVLQIASNANTYSQLNMQNINAGGTASSDFVATADDGDDSNYFVDLGINSSGFNDSTNYPGYAAHDSYLLNNGGNLLINATTAGKTIKLMVGGTDSGNVVASVANTGVTVTGSISVSNGIINTAGNGVSNIGGTGAYFNTVFAKATSAQYADLAEKYVADAEYAPGTVVVFGGDKEVTVTSVDADRAVAGVVSTNPSYIMNGTLEAEFVATVALTGRVPCRVTGTVKKGDLMVSAGYGLARAEADPKVGTVIGKALENFEGNEGVIEVVVGRF